jgi:hypothetical protein
VTERDSAEGQREYLAPSTNITDERNRNTTIYEAETENYSPVTFNE